MRTALMSSIALISTGLHLLPTLQATESPATTAPTTVWAAPPPYPYYYPAPAWGPAWSAPAPWYPAPGYGWGPSYGWGPWDGMGNLMGDMDFNFGIRGHGAGSGHGYGYHHYANPYWLAPPPYPAPAAVTTPAPVPAEPAAPASAEAPPAAPIAEPAPQPQPMPAVPAPPQIVAPPPVPMAPQPADQDRDGVADASDLCPNSTAGAQVDELGCEKGLNISLEGVNFKTDSADLTPESNAILDRVATTLSQHPSIKVEIAGHTDNIGDKGYNQQLSQRRTESVKNYLVNKGVSTDNLIPKGYGEGKPIASNATHEGRAKNRRVELVRQ